MRTTLPDSGRSRDPARHPPGPTMRKYLFLLLPLGLILGGVALLTMLPSGDARDTEKPDAKKPGKKKPKPPRDESEAVAALQKLGAQIERASGAGKPVVSVILFGFGVGDDEIKALEQLESLQRLQFAGSTRVGDAGFAGRAEPA